MTTQAGSTTLFRDVSIGDIERREFCVDFPACKDDLSLMIYDQESFAHTYASPGKYFTRLEVRDSFGNKAIAVAPPTVVDSSSSVNTPFVSLPESILTGATHLIDIGKQLDNTITFYVRDTGGACSFDQDITLDSDRDGDPTNDADYGCEAPFTIVYTPQAESTIARITNGATQTDILINFLDFEIDLPPELSEQYHRLNELINTVPQDATFTRSLLINIRNSLDDRTALDGLLLQLHDYVNTNGDNLDSTTSDAIMTIIDDLSDASVSVAL